MILKSLEIDAKPAAVYRSLDLAIELIESQAKYKYYRNYFKSLSLPELAADIDGFAYWDDGPHEQYRSPWIVYEQQAGDCDDVALLIALWARANRKQYRYVLAGYGNIIEHVFCEILDNNTVYFIDPFDQGYDIISRSAWRA